MEHELSELRSEVAALKGCGGGKRMKASLIQMTCLSQADVLFTDRDWNFCQQCLFTGIKFLPTGWKTYDPSNKKNFAALVKRHITVGRDVSFGGEWQHIMIDAIIRKYTDMRCNANNNIRKAFKGKY